MSTTATVSEIVDGLVSTGWTADPDTSRYFNKGSRWILGQGYVFITEPGYLGFNIYIAERSEYPGWVVPRTYKILRFMLGDDPDKFIGKVKSALKQYQS